MDPFARRKLGTSDVMLPQLGFGGAPLGNLFGPVPESEATATLDGAWDAGVRYYDTSPWYGRGLSELRLGQMLRQRPREAFVISTKVGRVFRPPADLAAYARSDRAWPHALLFEHRHDYSYDGIMRSYEDSLVRLGLPRIDVLIIHDLDFANMQSEALVDAHFVQLATGGIAALNDLKAAGRIGAIGAGVNRVGTIPQFLDRVDLDFFLVASPYTLTDQPVLDSEFPRCEKRGIGFVIGQVFASGILATGAVPGARYQYRDATPDELQRIGRIEAVCRRYEVPIAAAALQFPLHHPLVAAVIPGALTADQVRRNVATMQLEIPAELWRDLKRDGLLRDDAPTP